MDTRPFRFPWIVRKAGAMALAAALLLGQTTLLHADDDDDDDDARQRLHDRVVRGEIKSLAELRRIVLARVRGEIVSTELDEDDGVLLYEFRVLSPDNRLVEVEIDAASGRILEVENDE